MASLSNKVMSEESLQKIEESLEHVLGLLKSSKVSVDQLLGSNIGPFLRSIYAKLDEDNKPTDTSKFKEFSTKTKASIRASFSNLLGLIFCQLIKAPLRSNRPKTPANPRESPNNNPNVAGSAQIDQSIKKIANFVTESPLKKSVTSPLESASKNFARPSSFSHQRILSLQLPHELSQSSHLGKRMEIDSLEASDEEPSERMSVSKQSGLLCSPVKRKPDCEFVGQSHSGQSSVRSKAASMLAVKIETDSMAALEIEKTVSKIFAAPIKIEGADLPKLRKKVCRKIFQQLGNDLQLGKNAAKTAALHLEHKVHAEASSLSADDKDYLRLAKTLFQNLAVCSPY